MKPYSDRVLARNLLASSSQGFTIRGHLQRQRRFYGLVLAYFLAVLLILAALRLMPLFWLFLGLLLGFLLREWAWLGATKRSWSFVSRTTDWAKVRAMADDSASG
jgi:predicted tellurium resistance membrane protein TerC